MYTVRRLHISPLRQASGCAGIHLPDVLRSALPALHYLGLCGEVGGKQPVIKGECEGTKDIQEPTSLALSFQNAACTGAYACALLPGVRHLRLCCLRVLVLQKRLKLFGVFHAFLGVWSWEVVVRRVCDMWISVGVSRPVSLALSVQSASCTGTYGCSSLPGVRAALRER